MCIRDSRKYREDQDLVISRAKEAGLELIVNVGYNIASARRTVELTKKYDLIYGTVGMHPHDAKDLDGDGLRELKRLAQEPKIVAIGEICLLYTSPSAHLLFYYLFLQEQHIS